MATRSVFLMLALLSPMEAIRIPASEIEPVADTAQMAWMDLGEELANAAEKFGKSTKDSLMQLRADPWGTIALKHAAAAQKMFTSEMAKAHKDFQKKTKGTHEDSQKHHQAATQPVMDFAKELGHQMEKLGSNLGKTSETSLMETDPNWAEQAAKAQKLFNSQVAKAQQALEKHLKAAQDASVKQQEAATKPAVDFAKEASRHMEKLGKASKASLMDTEMYRNNWGEATAKARKMFANEVAKAQQAFADQMKVNYMDSREALATKIAAPLVKAGQNQLRKEQAAAERQAAKEQAAAAKQAKDEKGIQDLWAKQASKAQNLYDSEVSKAKRAADARTKAADEQLLKQHTANMEPHVAGAKEAVRQAKKQLSNQRTMQHYHQ